MMDVEQLDEPVEIATEMREHPGYGIEMHGIEVPLGEWATLISE